MRLLVASLFLCLSVTAFGGVDEGGEPLEASPVRLVVPGVLPTEEVSFEVADGTPIFPAPEPSRVVLLVIGILAFGLTFRCGLSRGKRRG